MTEFESFLTFHHSDTINSAQGKLYIDISCVLGNMCALMEDMFVKQDVAKGKYSLKAICVTWRYCGMDHIYLYEPH